MAHKKANMQYCRCFHSLFRALPSRSYRPNSARPLSTASLRPPRPRIPPSFYPPNIAPKIFTPPRKIKIYPPPPSTRKNYPEPLKHVLSSSLAVLDSNSSRTRLFDRSNPDCPQPGDILLATFTPDSTPASFSGVCLSIRRQGIDTAVLLRNRLMTTSVEMWVKVYSPKVRAIEVVEKTPKRMKRARLYYMRKPKHDRGSVEGVVEEYLKRRRLVRSGDMGVPSMGKGKIGGGKGGRPGGKTR